MNLAFVWTRLIVCAALATLATAGVTSCGSVTSVPDGGTGGAAGSQSGGGTSGTAGEGGTKAAGGTTGAAGTSAGGRGGAGGVGGLGGLGGLGGVGGLGGLGGRADGGTDGPLACRVDANDCPSGFTCACGGAGPAGTCTCHRNCTDANNLCPASEPMCGCPGSTTGGARFCVNACFCTCN